ncbi:MAG: hypothetical protein HMLKMBBP_03495 [Planctomycetes bacterium]|nr:hypothetical protein [Planctomycetota bacterium]
MNCRGMKRAPFAIAAACAALSASLTSVLRVDLSSAAEEAPAAVTIGRSGAVTASSIESMSFDTKEEISVVGGRNELCRISYSGGSGVRGGRMDLPGTRRVADSRTIRRAGATWLVCWRDAAGMWDAAGNRLWFHELPGEVTAADCSGNGTALIIHEVVRPDLRGSAGRELIRVLPSGDMRRSSFELSVRVDGVCALSDDGTRSMWFHGSAASCASVGESGIELVEVGEHAGTPLWSHMEPGGSVVVGDGNAAVRWREDRGRRLWRREGVPDLDGACVAVWTTEGSLLAVFGDRTIRFGSFAGGVFTVRSEWRVPAVVSSVACDRASGRLAAGTVDGFVYALESAGIRSLGPEGALGRQVSLAASPTRRHLLAADESSRWTVFDGDALTVMASGDGLSGAHGRSVGRAHAMAVSDDGAWLAGGSVDGRFIARCIKRRAQREVPLRLARDEQVRGVSIVADGNLRHRIVAAITDWPAEPGWSPLNPFERDGARCWDAETGRLIWSGLTGQRCAAVWPVDGAAFDRPGAAVMVVGAAELCVLSLDDGTVLRRARLPTRPNEDGWYTMDVVCPGLAATQVFIASGRTMKGDRMVLLTGVTSTTPVFRAGLSGAVVSASSMMKSPWMVIAGNQEGAGRVRLLRDPDLADGPGWSLGESAVVSIVATARGRVVSSHADGSIRLWDQGW